MLPLPCGCVEFRPPQDSKRLLEGATDHILDETAHLLHKLKSDKNFAGANWVKVESLLPNYRSLLTIYGASKESISSRSSRGGLVDSPDHEASHSSHDSHKDDLPENLKAHMEVTVPNPDDMEDSLRTDSGFHDDEDGPASDAPIISALGGGASASNDKATGEKETVGEDDDDDDSQITKAPTFLGRVTSIGNVLNRFVCSCFLRFLTVFHVNTPVFWWFVRKQTRKKSVRSDM